MNTIAFVPVVTITKWLWRFSYGSNIVATIIINSLSRELKLTTPIHTNWIYNGKCAILYALVHMWNETLDSETEFTQPERMPHTSNH